MVQLRENKNQCSGFPKSQIPNDHAQLRLKNKNGRQARIFKKKFIVLFLVLCRMCLYGDMLTWVQVPVETRESQGPSVATVVSSREPPDVGGRDQTLGRRAAWVLTAELSLQHVETSV